MSLPAAPDQDRLHLLAELRASVEIQSYGATQALSFGIDAIDSRLAHGGLDASGVHEASPASTTFGDDAAATLFWAGAAARFAGDTGHVVWALTRFDLYAPGLEQAGLAPDRTLYVEAKDETTVLAVAEDCLRDGSFAAVVAEVKAADQTATRRLQLAAADGKTPMLMLRRWKKAGRDPLEAPSSAMTRWRIGCAPSVQLGYPGVGRPRWSLELVRQRGGNPFSLIVEACDDTGRLALPSAAPDRAAAQGSAAVRAA